jgi:hypothetical protein
MPNALIILVAVAAAIGDRILRLASGGPVARATAFELVSAGYVLGGGVAIHKTDGIGFLSRTTRRTGHLTADHRFTMPVFKYNTDGTYRLIRSADALSEVARKHAEQMREMYAMDRQGYGARL